MNLTHTVEWGLENAQVGDMVEIISHRGDQRSISEVTQTSKRKVRLRNNMVFARGGKEWGHGNELYYGAHAGKILDLEAVKAQHERIAANLRLKKSQAEVYRLYESMWRSLTQLEVDTLNSILQNVKHRLDNATASS